MVSPERAPAGPALGIAAGVPDPELPMVTVADLGILRDVREDGDTVTLRATAPGTSGGRIALGEVTGTVVPGLTG